MAFANLVGHGLWIPPNPWGPLGTGSFSASDTALLNADEVEYQIIGVLRTQDGAGATFGASSSLTWLPGASITFQATATMRLGLKTTNISATVGPPARATVGQAAFDVYKDLIGGTDTITSTTARTDTMTNGSVMVSDGQLIAICFHLDVSANAQSIKIRQAPAPSGAQSLPAHTLITASGATFTAQAMVSNVMITFDDGRIGWIDVTFPFSAAQANSATIGNTNIKANIFRVPYPCKVSGIAAVLAVAGDFALDLYSTPLGTPSQVSTVACDANIVATASGRLYIRSFSSPITLAANTDYAIGVRQTSGTAQTVLQNDVQVASHFMAMGMGAECYAADSAAGATFAAVNSGKRRYSIHAMICALDDGTGGGGGGGMLQGNMRGNMQ